MRPFLTTVVLASLLSYPLLSPVGQRQTLCLCSSPYYFSRSKANFAARRRSTEALSTSNLSGFANTAFAPHRSKSAMSAAWACPVTPIMMPVKPLARITLTASGPDKRGRRRGDEVKWVEHRTNK